MEIRTDFVPVIVGGDVGVYSLARAFHEAYGVTTRALSESVPGPIADSRIIEAIRVPNLTDAEALIPALKAVAADLQPATLLLFGGSDTAVRLLTENAAELESAGYTIPGPSLDVLRRVTDKQQFAELAASLGIETPRTVAVSVGADTTRIDPITEFDFPVIAKAADSSKYENLSFPGKKKVFIVGSQSELDELWTKLQKAGFSDPFLVQELIPGDETSMRSVTAYVDTRGEVTMLGSAHVLLGEHTPTALGNTAAAITEDLGPICDQAAEFLRASGYRGFANFDIKVDPRDGRTVFFEVNPRIGRPNHYLTASSLNPAEFVVLDVIDGQSVAPRRTENEVLFSVVPKRLLPRYVTNPALKTRVKRLSRGRAHPLKYFKVDGGFARRRYVAISLLNQWRKFRRWYPAPTENGM